MDPLQKRIEGVSAHKFKGDYFMSVLEAVCLVVLVLIGAGDCRG